ncbi:MAG: hypothetical protein JW864_14660 [Spirochaetes bacterium]|nr:hypothetical protein [Spirochaetota bacterium]
MMKIRTGESIREVLCNQFNLPADYVENKISTIFLDGKPIDDIDSSHISDKATLSLSAAMPGLVGATMRRSGFYASLRNTISYSEDNNKRRNTDGMIRIKLFNSIIKEIGGNLLQEGIYISHEDLNLLITNKNYDFMQYCIKIYLNKNEIDLRILLKKLQPLTDKICVKMVS